VYTLPYTVVNIYFHFFMKKGTITEQKPVQKAPSAYDVAQLAGVSRTQVSYVLSGTGATHVSAEKRERILEAAKTLGYYPHYSAQTLRRGYSSEFAIFFPAPYNSRIVNIIGTIHEKGLTGDCVVTQYSWNSHHDPERKNKAFYAMLARRPLGIFCSLLDLDRKDIDAAKSSGVDRILVLDVERSDDLNIFFLPVEEIGRIAAEHLLAQGHKKIAIIRPMDPVQSRPFQLRYRGMTAVLAAEKSATLDILDFPQEDMAPSLTAAKAFTSTLLSLPERPTAIYAYSDDYALPLMTVLQGLGFKIPDDIAILGTDDIPYGELYTPALSTIRFDESALGERAVALINSLITGEAVEPRFLQDPFPYLIQREST
jgi:DNA-binding LacI/PurR family transcriptional regulator